MAFPTRILRIIVLTVVIGAALYWASTAIVSARFGKSDVEMNVKSASTELSVFCSLEERAPNAEEVANMLGRLRLEWSDVSIENIQYTAPRQCTGILQFKARRRRFSVPIPLPPGQKWKFPEN